MFGARLSRQFNELLEATATALKNAGHVVQHSNPRYPMTPAQFTRRWQGRGWFATMMGIAPGMGYANLWNVAGAAAVAVPAGTSDGLPIAVQLVGPAGSEPKLLSVAAQLEHLRPWDLAPVPH